MGQTYIYSPLSPATVGQGQGPALLLQFILSELFKTPHPFQEASETRHLPFDLAKPIGSYNKLQEHITLLPYAFPQLAEEARLIAKHLQKPSKKLFSLMKPFIMACKENENLLYFLLQHQKAVGVKGLLARISPEGLNSLEESVASKYDKRGFQLPAWMKSQFQNSTPLKNR